MLKCKVVEVAPKDQWDLSRNACKAVILEDGSMVHAASHVVPGDEIYLHPETREYLYHVLDPMKSPYTGPHWWFRRIKVRVRRFFDWIFCSLTYPHLSLDLLRIILTTHGETAVAEGAMLMLAAEEETLPEGDILEIGSYLGFSTACLGFGNRRFKKNGRVVGIDPHYFGSLEKFRKNIASLGLSKEIFLIAEPSDKAILQWKPEKLRVLWIDGHHEYEFVRIDVKLWEPFLVDGGVILFHDAKKPGVERVVKEFIKESGRYHSLGMFNGITYAVKGDASRNLLVDKIHAFEKIRNGFRRFADWLGLGVRRSAVMASEDAEKTFLRRKKHKSFSKTFLFLTAANLLGLIFVLGLFELGLRIFTPSDLAFLMKGREFKRWAVGHSSAYFVDTPYGKMKRLKPNFKQHVDYPYVSSYDVSISDQGLRTLTLEPNKKKIFAVGDSLTFGYWVDYEKSWPAKTDALLKKMGKDWQVVNAGIPGLSTIDEYIWIKDLVLQYKPDVILLGFSVGNDYYDNYKDRKYLSKLGISNAYDDQAVAKQTPWHQKLFDFQFYLPLREKIKTWSYLLNFLWTRLTPIGVAQNYWTFTYPYNPKFLQGIEITEKTISSLNDYLKSQGVKFSVLILPTKEQIDYERYEQDYAKRKRLAAWVGYHFPERERLPYYSNLMEDMLKKLGIPYLNLHAAFLEKKGQPLFFDRDFHPTEEGYDIIAGAAATFLEQYS